MLCFARREAVKEYQNVIKLHTVTVKQLINLYLFLE
jgi:hypothetical protein